jgi:outer membrane protein
MEAEIAQLREELQSQSLMLSEEKLAEKKLVLEQKYREYQQYMNDVFGEEGTAAKRNQELTAPIVEKINAVITQIAEEEGYTIIFDAAQGNIVYAKKAIDLTEKVLERLQSQMETVE